MLSDKYLVSEEEKYMVDLVVKVIEERKQSNQVGTTDSQFNHKILRFTIPFTKKKVYNDFIETGTEAVQEVTKLIDGKKVPAYTKEETDEIIVAQVRSKPTVDDREQLITMSFARRSRLFSCWLDSTPPPPPSPTLPTSWPRILKSKRNSTTKS